MQGVRDVAVVNSIPVQTAPAGGTAPATGGAGVAIATDGMAVGSFSSAGGSGLGGLTMSEDGGLEEVEESFRAAASCAWRCATVASSAFSRDSWVSNIACKRRQFGQDFRALDFMAGYATSLTAITQHW